MSDPVSKQLSGRPSPEFGVPSIAPEIFGQIVQKTRMAMSLADPHQLDCPLIFINPAFTEMTGYAPEDVLGRNCRFLQGPQTDPNAILRIHDAIAAREPINQELYNYRRDGSGFWNALFISPIYNGAGELIYFFASQYDTSARQESLRRESQRVASMDAFASGVAHEFNNLMTVVLGSIERAGARAVDEAQRRQLERADWGAQRAGRLASELLSLARRQGYHNRVVDLSETLRRFEDTLLRIAGDGVTVRVVAPLEPLSVRLDPGSLELVLINLARNAFDAMPGGGELEISARELSQPEATATLSGRRAVELRIADTGSGMPSEVLQRATELFFTTKKGGRGTGLGLFLALEFVDKCGGKLSIDSAEGQGCRVRLVLPSASSRGSALR